MVYSLIIKVRKCGTMIWLQPYLKLAVSYSYTHWNLNVIGFVTLFKENIFWNCYWLILHLPNILFLFFFHFRKMRTAIVFVLILAAASAQFFQPLVSAPVTFTVQRPPIPIQRQVGATPRTFGHRAVWRNSEMEARLPSELKNPFYKDPRIGSILAKESWFTNGEVEVKNREAEKIPRMKIYSILHNAGLVWKHNTPFFPSNVKKEITSSLRDKKRK